ATLLAFRGIQYWCAIFSIVALGGAVHSWTKTYWYLPFALAVFAFTGLEPIGMSSNLNYYTYPHMFLSLHIASLLFALHYGNGPARYGLMIVSGIFLWAAGASVLYMTVTVAGVVLLWILVPPPKESGKLGITRRDAALLLAPTAILWTLFLIVYGTEFVTAVLNMQRYSSEDLVHVLIEFNPRALRYLGVASVLLTLMTVAWRLTALRAGLSLIAISALAFFTVGTNVLGTIPGYWRGWFSAQMWAASFLAAVLIGVIIAVAMKRFRGPDLDDNQRLVALLAVPAGVFAITTTAFSGMGTLTVLHVGIPAVLAGTLFLMQGAAARRWPAGVRALGLVAILFPFTYHLALADWKFTYFDLSPKRLTHTLDHGFAKGIVTNQLYAGVVDWMEQRADKYSRPGDLAITLDEIAMGYMIIKRRPALNHSWTGYALSKALRKESIDDAIRRGRHPKIAFRFARAPLFFPDYSVKGERYTLAGVRNFPPEDPISTYILTHMQLVDTLQVQGDDFVEFYVRSETDGTVTPLD
ncbi:MAG: hypothetical protein HQ511_11265, partial [Rhodospirillales bacterium]|nr:hypothetical protein [Rhodospirillales bacterium]